MSDWRNTTIDDPTEWPTEKVVALPEANVDGRGVIQCLVNYPMKNVSLITSGKGSLRSNHYHKTDWHYMYMLSGSMEYHYRPTGSDEAAKMVIVKKGELVFTPPMEDHTSIFLEDSSLLALSRNPRDQATYEEDVVRVNLVDPSPYTIR